MMKNFFLVLCSFWITQIAFAQNIFKGIVCEDSISKTAIFQAEIFVLANGTQVLKLSSDFDGSFAIKTVKNTFYSIKVSYPGTKDVSYEFQTDKKGKPSVSSALFVMKRDGLRLVGKVLSEKTNLPIGDAVLVLKDIQTREETRFTTKSDGAYNLKLHYETNYRVSIDKRSPGIVNRYEDTVFFVSTIGFNQPLDYALNIALRPVQQLTNRTEYIPIEDKPATKPVVEVQPNLNPDGTPLKGRDEEEKKTVEHKKNEKKEQKSKVKKEEKVSDSKNEIKPKKVKNVKTEKANKSPKEKAQKPAKSEAKSKKQKIAKPKKETGSKKEKEMVVDVPKQAVDTMQKVQKKVVTEEIKSEVKNTPIATIYFVKNATFVTEYSKAKLKAAIEEIKATPLRTILLNAHAGKDEQNVELLCQTRLKAITQYLVQSGVDVNKISTKSFAAEIPANECHLTKDCPEQKLILNRRVEIILK
ncbi:MAG TPA: OmpA family protein [Chitinophagales bacterium]|nr:OmpA family protein [Chitinophagales bacterium]HRP38633.1 OmpA family protein [Chitinophagales bacterium]